MKKLFLKKSQCSQKNACVGVTLESPLNKVAGLKAWNFIKKRLQHRCFPVNIAKFLKAPFLKNIYLQTAISASLKIENYNYTIPIYETIYFWKKFVSVFGEYIFPSLISLA